MWLLIFYLSGDVDCYFVVCDVLVFGCGLFVGFVGLILDEFGEMSYGSVEWFGLSVEFFGGVGVFFGIGGIGLGDFIYEWDGVVNLGDVLGLFVCGVGDVGDEGFEVIDLVLDGG